MSRNKNPEETVKRILDTAALLFMEKGYEKTSLQDIINQTHLSKGAIYHHFASKEEIFIQICTRVGEQTAIPLAKVRDNKALNGAEKLKQIFQVALSQPLQEQMLNMVPYLVNNPKFLVIEIKSIYEEVVPYYIQPILEEGIADGSLHCTHPKETAEALMMLTDVWMHPLLQPSTPEEMRARCHVLNQLIRPIGIELLDEERIEALVKYSCLLQNREKESHETAR